MKKQYKLAILILVTGVCFCSINDNSLKACGTTAATCSAIEKTNLKNIPSDYTEDVNASFDIFMSPLIRL